MNAKLTDAQILLERIEEASVPGTTVIFRRRILAEAAAFLRQHFVPREAASPIGRPTEEPEASKSADRVEQIARMVERAMNGACVGAGAIMRADDESIATETAHSIASLFAPVEAENAILRAALGRVDRWINTSVPIGTESATYMLGEIRQALGLRS